MYGLTHTACEGIAVIHKCEIDTCVNIGHVSVKERSEVSLKERRDISASDLYSEHSDVGSKSPTRTHATDKIES